MLNVMRHVGQESIVARRVDKKIKKKKQPFTSGGQSWVVSYDGHQSSTFLFGVYGF